MCVQFFKECRAYVCARVVLLSIFFVSHQANGMSLSVKKNTQKYVSLTRIKITEQKANKLVHNTFKT